MELAHNLIPSSGSQYFFDQKQFQVSVDKYFENKPEFEYRWLRHCDKDNRIPGLFENVRQHIVETMKRQTTSVKVPLIGHFVGHDYYKFLLLPEELGKVFFSQQTFGWYISGGQSIPFSRMSESKFLTNKIIPMLQVYFADCGKT